MAVRNVGTVDATYSIVVESPTGGFVTPAPAAWFAIEPGSMALAAGSLGEVRIVVRPPDDAAPGVYSAVLRIADAAALRSEAAANVDISFVVFGDGEDGGTSGTPGGSDDADDLGELLENPVVIIVGIVLVVWAMRRLFGGRRPPANAAAAARVVPGEDVRVSGSGAVRIGPVGRAADYGGANLHPALTQVLPLR